MAIKRRQNFSILNSESLVSGKNFKGLILIILVLGFKAMNIRGV